MSNTISPVPRFQFFSDAGLPLNGGKLYTYVSGSSTPLVTYSTSTGTANANPIILDSAGRCSIYLADGLSYKFVLKTSAGVTVWTANSISAVPSTTTAGTFNSVCDLRLTFASGTPVPTTDLIGSPDATTLYATPYQGNRVALYDGSTWSIENCTELQYNISGSALSANSNFDVFVYLDPLGQGLTLDVAGWASATARSVALALQDGVYVKSTDATWRYLGTFRTTGTIGESEDSAAKRFLWNYYHRVNRSLAVAPTTDSWTYTTPVYRQANADTTNQVAVVVGLAESLLQLRLTATLANTAAATPTIVSIGEDSTSSQATGVQGMLMDSPAVNSRYQLSAALTKYPAIGYHYYSWLEYSNAVGTTTWYGDAGIPNFLQSGLVGTIHG